MLDQNFLENQTIFAEEEPFHIANRKKRSLESAKLKKPFWVYISGVVAIVVIATVAMVMIRNGQQQPISTVVTPTPTLAPKNASQIDQMMIELRSAVDNADPSKTGLPFPPVAYQIKISQ